MENSTDNDEGVQERWQLVYLAFGQTEVDASSHRGHVTYQASCYRWRHRDNGHLMMLGMGTMRIPMQPSDEQVQRFYSDHAGTLIEQADAEVERVMGMSEEELRAEILADGRDPDEEIAKTRATIERAIEKHRAKRGER